MFSHTYTQTGATPWGTVQDAGRVFSAAATNAINEDIPVFEASDNQFPLELAAAGLKSLALLADQPCVVTLEADPENIAVLPLPAGELRLIETISDDLVSMVIGGQEGSTGGGVLKVRAIYDPTP